MSSTHVFNSDWLNPKTKYKYKSLAVYNNISFTLCNISFLLFLVIVSFYTHIIYYLTKIKYNCKI